MLVVGERVFDISYRQAISDELGTTYEKKACVETKASVNVEHVHMKHF